MGEVAAGYVMKGSCGNLKEKDGLMLCNVWGTDEQPEACKEFTPGCVTCILLQLRDSQKPEQ